jgi:hypothetical protein
MPAVELYKIILGEKPKILVLITAYCIDHDSYRDKLRKERDILFKMQKPPG